MIVPMLSHTEAVRAAIDSLRGTLQLAAALMHVGRQVDLAGLDQEAARLCAALAILPEAEGQALRPALEDLLREIDRATAAVLEPPD